MPLRRESLSLLRKRGRSLCAESLSASLGESRSLCAESPSASLGREEEPLRRASQPPCVPWVVYMPPYYPVYASPVHPGRYTLPVHAPYVHPRDTGLLGVHEGVSHF